MNIVHTLKEDAVLQKPFPPLYHGLLHKHCSECIWTEDGSEPPKIFHYDMCVCMNQTFEENMPGKMCFDLQ